MKTVQKILKQLDFAKKVEVEVYNNKIVTYHEIFNNTIKTLWTRQGKMIRQQKIKNKRFLYSR